VIIEAIIIARRVFNRIRSFMTYRIAATLQLLSFFFIAVFAFEPLSYIPDSPKFFHMPVLMLMLITLLNDGTLITIGYDVAIPNETPCKWNLMYLFTIASVLAGVAMVSSLILVYLLLDSHRDGSFMQQLGIGKVPYGQITAAVYLKVSASDFLTLFSARAGGQWFWEVAPATVLLIGGIFALTISTLLALFWPSSKPDKIPTEGLVVGQPKTLVVFVWIWTLVWWFAVDAAKVFTRWYVYKYNVFNINDTGEMVMTESALRVKKEIEESKQTAMGHH